MTVRRLIRPLASRLPAAHALLAGLAMVLTVTVADAEPSALPVTLRMGASTTWAENISRSASPGDWRDTLRHEGSVTAGLLTPLASGVSLISDAAVGYESVPRFVRNTDYTAYLQSALRWKFGLGAFAPVATAEAGLARRESRIDGDTGWFASGTLHVAKRFTDAWRASLTGDWEQHYAAHPTFDTRHHRLFGTLSWDITDHWQLTYGRGSLWGDFVANASPLTWSRAFAGQISPAVAVYYPTLSYETSNSYGPGWVSYRAKGRSDFWWLELSPALGPNTSLPLRFESTYTENFVGVHYRQSFWTLGILHRY
jgi:hypothetical protein